QHVRRPVDMPAIHQCQGPLGAKQIAETHPSSWHTARGGDVRNRGGRRGWWVPWCGDNVANSDPCHAPHTSAGPGEGAGGPLEAVIPVPGPKQLILAQAGVLAGATEQLAIGAIVALGSGPALVLALVGLVQQPAVLSPDGGDAKAVTADDTLKGLWL